MKEFVKKFDRLCSGSKMKYEVWKDMIVMFAMSISNAVFSSYKDQEPYKSLWSEREERYLRTIKKYSKEEQKVFPELLALLVQEYEEKGFDDVLGKLYMTLEIASKSKGQFFTPYNLSKLISDLSMDRKQVGKLVHKKGYVSINDCACGAGGTLIAAAERCQNDLFKKYNWQNHVWFTGQDVDETCALMCYIQLSLLGCPGYVSVGNSLTESSVTDLNRIYFTPMYFNRVWIQRRFFHNLDLLMRKRKDC